MVALAWAGRKTHVGNTAHNTAVRSLSMRIDCVFPALFESLFCPFSQQLHGALGVEKGTCLRALFAEKRARLCEKAKLLGPAHICGQRTSRFVLCDSRFPRSLCRLYLLADSISN